MSTQRGPGGRFSGALKEHVDGEAGIAVRDFMEDSLAVSALTHYLDSASGKKLRKLMVALEPTRLLASDGAWDATKLRVLPKYDAENAAQILARSQGWQSLVTLITERLIQPLPEKPKGREMARNWNNEDDKE